jgi:hypothetical protein
MICRYFIIIKKPKKSPMAENFTLLLLSQHYPVSQQFQVLSYDDVSIDADVTDFLKAAEQHVSRHVLDHINAYASSCC